MRNGREIAGILVLLLTAACGVEEGDAPPARVEEPPLQPAPEARPETGTDTLHIEGMPHVIEVRLVASPPDFPLPFTTYVPPDVEVADADRGDQAEVRFSAKYGAGGPAEAWLEISAYPTDLTDEAATERARRAAGAAGVRVRADEPMQPWSIAEWRVQPDSTTEGRMGRVMLGRHGERYFHVRTLYPPEFGDGFGPRAALVLRHVRWGDGSPLFPPREDATGLR